MPSIGHIAVGLGAGQAVTPTRDERWRWMLWYAAISCAADLDFGLVILGVPKDSLWGHRGASHSLGMAILAGVVAVGVGRRWGQPALVAGVNAFLLYTSHLAFDCLNVGSLGVPWLWPLSSHYYTLPWHPIPAVETAGEFLTLRGLPVLAAELVIFAPFWLYAWLGRRSPDPNSSRGSPMTDRSPSWRRRAEGAAEADR